VKLPSAISTTEGKVWGWGVEIYPVAKSCGPNSNALAYAECAQST